MRSAVSAPAPHCRGETKTVHRSDNAATTGWRPVSPPHSRNTARRDKNGDGGPGVRLAGVGLRRGRRHPDEIYAGESLDFWRVVTLEPNRIMRLHAEMKVPGEAWLQFESLPQENGKTILKVLAYFDARGFFGLLYWYSMFPFHKFIFDGLTSRLASRARVLAHSYD